jgi:hypothetical protein
MRRFNVQCVACTITLTKRREFFQSLWENSGQLIVEEIELTKMGQTVQTWWNLASKIVCIQKERPYD